jgi:Ca2+-binding EF-hand superfamily protein
MAANMKANTPPRFYYKRATALLVAAIVVALVVPSAGTHSNAAEVGVHKVVTNTVLLSLTALAIIAVSFEMGNHHLHHHTEDIFKPVLHAINSELMSVGFLAVLFYFMLKFKLLIKASESTICKNCDPCNNGGCTATKLKSSLTNSYWKSTNHSKLTNGYIVKPGTRRLLDELNDEEIVNTMLWRMGHVSAPPPLSGLTTRRLHARRLAGGPAVPRAVGSWDANPAKVSYEYYANGTAKWKDLVGATSCDATAGKASRRLSVEERHRAAWGAENWDRLQGARRRLGGASNPMYTCECKDCDTKLILLWENVHMGLFLCLVLYFIRSIVLLGQTQKIAKKWKRTEAIIQTKGIKAMVQNYYDVHDHAVDQEGLDSVARAHAEEDMEYLMLRTRFVKTGNGGAPLENDFSFAEYLSILFAHTAAHVVHIPPAAWVVLELFFILFWAAMNGSPKIRIRVFVLYLCFGFGFLALLIGKMRSILDQLTAQWPAPTGKKYVVTDELVETLSNVKPSYLDADSVGGQQHKLFWFHSWGNGFGPGFLMHMIRLMTLVQIIFAVLMINAVPFAQSYDSQFLGVLIAIFVPLLASNYYLPPMLLKLQTIITSIELTKNPHAIEETIRTVKFSKSIRTIKLLKSLQSVAAMSKSKAGEPGPKKVLGPETDDELERKVQMKEVFAMFDESGDGEVDLEEMSGLMSSVGVSFSDEDKLLMMRDFDSSGDGTISFEEFWQYMRQMAVPSDPQQIVEDVFSLIDKDGSGSITAQEFSDQMKALPCEISEQDIESLVREVDHSGDGEIDLHEFAAVLKKYV